MFNVKPSKRMIVVVAAWHGGATILCKQYTSRQADTVSVNFSYRKIKASNYQIP